MSAKRVLLIILANLVIIGLIYGAFLKSGSQTVVPSGIKPENVRDEDFSTTDTTIMFDANVDVKENMAEVRDAISYFPIPVLEAFNDNGWKFMIVQDIKTPTGKTGSDLSYTNFIDKAIQIKNMNTPGLTKVRALLEMSRFADLYYGNASETEEFAKLYSALASAYVEYEYVGVEKTAQNQKEIEYAKQSAANFFAAGLKDYLYHPDYIQMNYKDLFDYYEALLGRNKK